MGSWIHKLNYILSNTETIHRFYSSELQWCYLTDRTSRRHRIDNTMSLEQIHDIIENIKRINSYGTYAVQEHHGGAYSN